MCVCVYTNTHTHCCISEFSCVKQSRTAKTSSHMPLFLQKRITVLIWSHIVYSMLSGGEKKQKKQKQKQVIHPYNMKVLALVHALEMTFEQENWGAARGKEVSFYYQATVTAVTSAFYKPLSATVWSVDLWSQRSVGSLPILFLFKLFHPASGRVFIQWYSTDPCSCSMLSFPMEAVTLQSLPVPNAYQRLGIDKLWFRGKWVAG